MEIKGKKALVFGLKKSGKAAALALNALGAEVAVTDIKKAEELDEEFYSGLPPGIKLHLGSHEGVIRPDIDFIVLSPGVPSDIEPLREAGKMGIKIMAEIELGYRLIKSATPDMPFYAITGTNGKSTTTTLLHLMLEEAGIKSLLAGNIGNPLTGELDEARGKQAVVLEVSSFQLEGIEGFRPRVAAILNLAPDHLDRHHLFGDYTGAKARIFETQGEGDLLVLNADDPTCLQMARRLVSERPGAPAVFFFGKGRPLEGVYEKAGRVFVSVPGFSGQLMRADEIRIKGVHNLENAMAAALMAILAGAPPGAAAKALREFPGLEHRMEFVRELDGVAYVNDSKGTNPPATLRSLESFGDAPIILIAGGRDKKGDFASLRDAVQRHVRLVLLIGEAAEKIRKALDGEAPMENALDLAHALRIARQSAKPGDVVLLSPACASFDMFRDFEDRGGKFKQEVGRL